MAWNETKKALSEDLFAYAKGKQWKAGRRNAQAQLSIIRYCDDFVIIHESLELIEKAKKFVQQWLKQMGARTQRN